MRVCHSNEGMSNLCRYVTFMKVCHNDKGIYIYITGPLMSVLLFKPYRLRDRLT